VNTPTAFSTFDLHTHSWYSDGHYSPTELVERAKAQGIRVLALTDHDTTAGIREARDACKTRSIRLIPGVEVSVTWEKKTIHVIGLGIDLDEEHLQATLSAMGLIRESRAEEMGQRLARQGISGVFEDARQIAGVGMVTRTHFAKVLAARGHALDVRDVFGRFLTPGKPGYVSTTWAPLEEAVACIRKAGGCAVIAHPLRYRLTRTWLRRLAGEFRELGGQGIEVLSGQPSPGDMQSMRDFAIREQLRGSCGSDFHGPDEGWPKLGRVPLMPAGIEPVWSDWSDVDGLA
jgi:predicted metal-dependent phosphoesterase TrpH